MSLVCGQLTVDQPSNDDHGKFMGEVATFIFDEIKVSFLTWSSEDGANGSDSRWAEADWFV